MFNISSMSDAAMKLAKDMSQKTEESILEQLNDFVSRGLIEIQLTQPILVRSSDSSKLEIRQGCVLVLKDKEYILDLEDKVKKYEELLLKLKGITL